MRTKCVVVMILVLAMGVGLVGCLRPPAGTVPIDTDADGTPDALAIDANEDGRPDLDPAGNPKIVKGSKKVYGAAGIVDRAMPWVLGTVGLLGLPVATRLGIWWKGAQLGRLAANLVMSVQAGRRAVKKASGPEVLAILDGALHDVQNANPKVEELIAKLKKAMNAKPVSG